MVVLAPNSTLGVPLPPPASSLSSTLLHSPLCFRSRSSDALSNQQLLQTTRLCSPAHKATWHALPWWTWMRGIVNSAAAWWWEKKKVYKSWRGWWRRALSKKDAKSGFHRRVRLNYSSVPENSLIWQWERLSPKTLKHIWSSSQLDFAA